MKVFALIEMIKRIILLIPKNERVNTIDAILDAIEKNNLDNSKAMAACAVARGVLQVPDDDTDQAEPV